MLCDHGWDLIVSLQVSCVRALTFHSLLVQSSESEEEFPLTHMFPAFLCPLYNFFSSRGNMSSAPKDDSGDPPVEVSSEQPAIAKEQRHQALLSDGLLINLALFAKAILSNNNVDPSILSFCWKTLNLLQTGLGIALVKVSDHVVVLFDEVHNETCQCVQTKERGFCITPLLEILDTVAQEGALVWSYMATPSSSTILIASLRKITSEILISFRHSQNVSQLLFLTILTKSQVCGRPCLL
jgi:hypothetical protein